MENKGKTTPNQPPIPRPVGFLYLYFPFVSSWLQVNYAKQTQFPKPQSHHNPFYSKDLRQYSPSPQSKKQTQSGHTGKASRIEYPASSIQPCLCKTNPIPQRPKPTQPLMPHGFTTIFHSTQPQKTKPKQTQSWRNTRYAIRNSQYAIRNTQYAIRNTQYAIRNTQYAIRNTRYAIRNTQYEIRNPSLAHCPRIRYNPALKES